MKTAGVIALTLGGVLCAAGSWLAATDAGVRPSLDGPRAAAVPLGRAPTSAGPVVEIRSYNLKPGTRAEVDRLVRETAPLLLPWKIDIVGFGPSHHDENSYVLVRAFADLADRQRKEDGFYGSREWREGNRDRVLALIESYTTVVLPMDSATVAGLRAAFRR